MVHLARPRAKSVGSGSSADPNGWSNEAAGGSCAQTPGSPDKSKRPQKRSQKKNLGED